MLIEWTDSENAAAAVVADSDVPTEALKVATVPPPEAAADAEMKDVDGADAEKAADEDVGGLAAVAPAVAGGVEVAEETLDKMEKEKWSGVNGCYDDAGDWRDWTQIIALSSYGGDDINILPYVDIDG